MSPAARPGGGFRALTPNAQGALWILASSVTFVMMTSLVKHLSGDYSANLQNFYRQTGVLIAALPFLMHNPRRVLVVRRMPTLLVRSLSATVGMVLLVYSYEALPMAEANALSFSRPLWVTLLAALVLRETLGLSRIAAVSIGFVGVLVIMRPWASETIIGWPHAAALVSALLLAVTITGVKSLTRDLSAVSILVWSAILGEILSLPLALMDWRWPDPADLVFLLCLGGLSAANQVFFIKGMAVGEAAALAPIDYSRLVLSIAAGLLFFGEVPDGVTIAGAAIIVISTLYITFREARRRAPVVALDDTGLPEVADQILSPGPDDRR
jgi:drug/metabolite transporter (DMT)-like permease